MPKRRKIRISVYYFNPKNRFKLLILRLLVAVYTSTYCVGVFSVVFAKVILLISIRYNNYASLNGRRPGS
jgi:hypothetical protein